MPRALVVAVLSAVSIAGLAWTAHSEPPAADPAPTDAYDLLLRRAVTGGGRVDYRALKADGAAANTLAAMRASTVPAAAPVELRIAHGINAYNATVIEVVLANWDGIRKADNGVLSVGGFFDKTLYEIAGEKITLNAFEARYRALGRPAVHFGFNCASEGCPPVLPRAYRAATVTAELDAAARAYLAQVSELAGSRVRTSELFFWYGGDWAKDSDPSKEAGRAETRRRLLEWLDPRHPVHRYLAATAQPVFENRADWSWKVNAVSRDAA